MTHVTRGEGNRRASRYNADKRRNGRGEGAEERVRLRAINTRGCVLQARVSRVEQSTWTGTAAFPIRSRRRDITLPVGEFRVPPRLCHCICVHYTRDAFTGVSRGKATRARLVRRSSTSSPIFFVGI